MSERFLLDTCTFLWTAMNPDELSKTARAIIKDRGNRLFLSAASGWEILGKSTKGKLEIKPGTPAAALKYHISQLSDLGVLPIRMEHLYQAYTLPEIHKDPIDRILIGQAQSESMTIITPDQDIQKYNVQTLW